MLVTRRGFRIFTEFDLAQNLDAFLLNIEKEIELDRNVLVQDEEEYIKQKLQNHTIKILVVYPEKVGVSQQEVEIDSRYFPQNFFVERGQSYPKQVITFHLPFDGDEDFFRCKPSTFIMRTEEVDIRNNEILFEIINFSNNAEEIQKSRDDILSLIQGQMANVNKQIEAYNSSLTSVVITAVKKAKEKFGNQDDLLSKLGNPIKNG